MQTRRRTIAGAAGLAAAALTFAPRSARAQQLTLRMSTPATPTDQRSIALQEVFAPAVAGFATYQPHYNSSLFKQGTELEAIARNNLEMSITSAQELATIIQTSARGLAFAGRFNSERFSHARDTVISWLRMLAAAG